MGCFKEDLKYLFFEGSLKTRIGFDVEDVVFEVINNILCCFEVQFSRGTGRGRGTSTPGISLRILQKHYLSTFMTTGDAIKNIIGLIHIFILKSGANKKG